MRLYIYENTELGRYRPGALGLVSGATLYILPIFAANE